MALPLVVVSPVAFLFVGVRCVVVLVVLFIVDTIVGMIIFVAVAVVCDIDCVDVVVVCSRVVMFVVTAIAVR